VALDGTSPDWKMSAFHGLHSGVWRILSVALVLGVSFVRRPWIGHGLGRGAPPEERISLCGRRSGASRPRKQRAAQQNSWARFHGQNGRNRGASGFFWLHSRDCAAL
jgi:hypothetical protein